MEFPRIVYFGVQTPGAWRCKRVDTAEECEQALTEGWSLTPTLVGQEPAAVLAPAPVCEPDPAPEPPKRRGRPRKAQP